MRGRIKLDTLDSNPNANTTPISNSIPRPLVRTNQWFIVISVLAAWVSGAYSILLLPFIAGVMGLFLNYNPVMRFAKVFLHKPMASYLPEDRDQQQFNQWIAVICLALAFLTFAANWRAVGYVFSALVLLAAAIAICGFCIGCFVRFPWIRFKQKRCL